MPDLINWDAHEPLSRELIEKLAGILESGNIIVYPTNTLYGIGGSILSEIGIKKVHSIKGRPEGMPLSIMATPDQIENLCQLTENAQRFITLVDSAAVYVNASTRFTDGSQLGLGAEVAISTQRLHARGPMALKELTTYKWVIMGNNHIRE